MSILNWIVAIVCCVIWLVNIWSAHRLAVEKNTTLTRKPRRYSAPDQSALIHLQHSNLREYLLNAESLKRAECHKSSDCREQFAGFVCIKVDNEAMRQHMLEALLDSSSQQQLKLELDHSYCMPLASHSPRQLDLERNKYEFRYLPKIQQFEYRVVGCARPDLYTWNEKTQRCDVPHFCHDAMSIIDRWSDDDDLLLPFAQIRCECYSSAEFISFAAGGPRCQPRDSYYLLPRDWTHLDANQHGSSIDYVDPCKIDALTGEYLPRIPLDQPQLFGSVLTVDNYVTCWSASPRYITVKFDRDYLLNNNGTYANGIVRVMDDNRTKTWRKSTIATIEVGTRRRENNRHFAPIMGYHYEFLQLRSALAQSLRQFFSNTTAPQFDTTSTERHTSISIYNFPSFSATSAATAASDVVYGPLTLLNKQQSSAPIIKTYAPVYFQHYSSSSSNSEHRLFYPLPGVVMLTPEAIETLAGRPLLVVFLATDAIDLYDRVSSDVAAVFSNLSDIHSKTFNDSNITAEFRRRLNELAVAVTPKAGSNMDYPYIVASLADVQRWNDKFTPIPQLLTRKNGHLAFTTTTTTSPLFTGQTLIDVDARHMYVQSLPEHRYSDIAEFRRAALVNDGDDVKSNEEVVIISLPEVLFHDRHQMFGPKSSVASVSLLQSRNCFNVGGCLDNTLLGNAFTCDNNNDEKDSADKLFCNLFLCKNDGSPIQTNKPLLVIHKLSNLVKF